MPTTIHDLKFQEQDSMKNVTRLHGGYQQEEKTFEEELVKETKEEDVPTLWSIMTSNS